MNNMKKKIRLENTGNFNRYRNMTPAQKWAEVVKLREMAWNLKCAAIRDSHPDWSEERVKRAVRDIFLYAST